MPTLPPEPLLLLSPSAAPYTEYSACLVLLWMLDSYNVLLQDVSSPLSMRILRRGIHPAREARHSPPPQSRRKAHDGRGHVIANAEL
ncbi:hypothetical protein NUW54_g12045 [Trametes sanguinea]|uniref:Uncharacterized protein n=1 Tax=Trametes sanguinea TaxID=158606 RepID=A0ACC1N523_9APHY|nr:hypothetical protein NUW54_g12045 [Trametes sanguinea]